MTCCRLSIEGLSFDIDWEVGECKTKMYRSKMRQDFYSETAKPGIKKRMRGLEWINKFSKMISLLL